MTRQHFAMRCLSSAVFAISLSIVQLACAQVTLNFVDADISQVAKAVGAATGKTIIVDPRVKGQLNLVAEEPVSQEKALKTLQSALRMQGFALVQDHGVLKVVPEADAKQQGVPVFVGNAPAARGDQIITQVFQLRYEAANSLVPILRPLISPNNTITAYPANNTLVITDYADNLHRIAAIIAGIDRLAGQNVEVVPLKNANALELAAQLQKLLDPGAIGAADATLRVSVMADPRTNALLLRASNKARIKAAKQLIAKLDLPTRAPGNIHVVPLRNADAVQLAKTLRGMLGGGHGNADSATAGDVSAPFNLDNKLTGAPGLPPLPAASKGGALAAPLGQAGLLVSKKDESDNQPAGGMVRADAASNSLVVTTSEPVYRNLRRVIDQLDARRAQIYIESLIVEISSSDAARFGIQWQTLLSSHNAFAGTNYTVGGDAGTNIISVSPYFSQLLQAPPPTGLIPPAQGLNIGYLRGFGNFFGLGGLLQALNSLGSVNVLSTPTMVILDNEEAKIVVGQNVPILTGSYAQTGEGKSVTPFQTFDRQDVGITLHVKPKITEGGVIQLQIYQEDSGVVGATQSNPGGVTINKRSIQSTVLADDGQVIVLGGLLQDKYIDGNAKVPLLGDLPLIGALFRYESKLRDKTNLMVFLRPLIMRDAQAAQRLSTDRYDYMRARTLNYSTDNWVVRDKNTPIMPSTPSAPSAPNQSQLPALLAPQQRGPNPPLDETPVNSSGQEERAN